MPTGVPELTVSSASGSAKPPVIRHNPMQNKDLRVLTDFACGPLRTTITRWHLAQKLHQDGKSSLNCRVHSDACCSINGHRLATPANLAY